MSNNTHSVKWGEAFLTAMLDIRGHLERGEKDRALLFKMLKRIGQQNNLLFTLAGLAFPEGPGFKYPLAEWREFNWASINAEVVERDADGVALVRWGGDLYARRSEASIKGKDIWYSRAIAREGNTNVYATLAKFSHDFKKPSYQPLVAEVRALVNQK